MPQCIIYKKYNNMDGTLFVPYVKTDLEEDNFIYNGPSFDYSSKLDEVANSIVGGQWKNNQGHGNSIGFNAIGAEHKEYSDQIDFYELKCRFFNDKEEDETIEELFKHHKDEDSFMFMFSFDQNNSDEDCLIELKGWISESKKVMNMPEENCTQESKMLLLPKRQFKIKIGKATGFLEECMLFDTNDDKIVIFVKKINFYKE
jgi:hypothetical protein